MTLLTFYLAVFVALGIFFLMVHLLMGKLLRPARPVPEKLTIYECGEPTVGSAWIQFDLRYYVVALLFVIFDVEVAFFFPWALVFGQATALADPDLAPAARQTLTTQLVPPSLPPVEPSVGAVKGPVAASPIDADTAQKFSWMAFADVLVFFGVLLVGFAYLWRRGDIDWVRSVRAEQAADAETPVPPAPALEELVGSGPTF